MVMKTGDFMQMLGETWDLFKGSERDVEFAGGSETGEAKPNLKYFFDFF